MSEHRNAARRPDGSLVVVRFLGEDCWVEFAGRYAPGGFTGPLALRLRMMAAPPNDTDLMATATVNVAVDEDLMRRLGAGEVVLVKSWSENEGMVEALAAAGLVEDTGEVVETGHAAANLCRLLVAVPQEITGT